MAAAQRLRGSEAVSISLAALLVALASSAGWWSISLAEALGFISGGVCVWLVVRENVWNWPVGLANNAFFFLLFWQSRLFADMGLQLVYFALGVYGWRNWLAGEGEGTPLRIRRASRCEWLALTAFVVAATWWLRKLLIAAHGAAPFWDALTTALSLAAQYLLCRKRLESWFLWIAVDVMYIPLYLSRDLPLTAVLYGVFLILCLIGLNQWRSRWAELESAANVAA
jgi:nicotinamide mononucleotide transporter